MESDLRKRRTRIVMESEEVLVARCAAKPVIAWCPECRAESTKLTAIEAALLCRVDEDTMQQWVRTGQLPFLTARIRPRVSDRGPSPSFRLNESHHRR